MPTTKLTERSIARLEAPTPNGKQAIHWDEALRGFGVLCSGVSNAKTYVVQRTLADGRSRRVTVGACNVLSLTDARLKAEGVLSQFYAGVDPKGGRRDAVTLRQALEQYLAESSKLGDRSRKFYRSVVERHLAAWLDLPMRSISGDMVQDRHRSIQAEVADGARYTGSAMANSTMTALGILWNHAAEKVPSLPQNPVRRLRRQWFAVPRRERMVKADELPKFYKAVVALPSAVHRDLILMLLHTGLRRGEATGLRWDDVDFAARMVRIPAHRMKAKRKHDLPMSTFVHDLLVARRAIGKTDLVFPSSSAAVDPTPAFRAIAEATGIKVSPHDLRRTFITVAESADISPMALKVLVAHSTGSDVTAGYTIISTERLREAMQRVCDRMKMLCEAPEPIAENVARMRG